MKPMNIDDAMRAEKLLLELAMYDVTHGHQLDWKIKSQDEYHEVLKKVDKRFAEYKRLILSGESSWDKLSDTVLTKYACDLRKFIAGHQPAQPHGEEPTVFGFDAHTKIKNKKDQ